MIYGALLCKRIKNLCKDLGKNNNILRSIQLVMQNIKCIKKYFNIKINW